jgi:hypothetical protein
LNVPFRNTSFDPDTLRIAQRAYDQACSNVTNAADPNIIAQRIIDLATAGERDADLLATFALDAIPEHLRRDG